MGLFDSLFGSDTVETSSQTDSKVRFPIQFRDLATAVGQMGSELAGKDPNQLVAGFSPDQLAAFQALRDMATTDPTGYFDVIQQLQQEGLSAGDNAALTSGLSSLTNLVQTSQNDPTVAASIDKLMADPSARDVNAESYRPGVTTDTVSADPYSTAAIEDTMSPYRDQVIDQFNTNFNAQADRTRAASARERAGRRAFGSRSDLAETEEDKNLTDSYNTALTNLLEGGFTNAQQQFNTNTGVSVDTQKANQAAKLQAGLAGQSNALTAEQANQGKDVDLAKLGQTGAQGAGQLALDQSKLGGDLSSQLAAAGIDQSKLGLAGAQAAGDAAGQERATAIGNAGLVSSVGDAYQQQQQKALDAPWTQLDRAAGVLAGVPTTASSNTTGTAPSGQASPISQLAGAGLAAYGIIKSADGGVVGGLDSDFLSPRGMKRMMADGGQIGVKEQAPHLGERDPRFAWSLLDDTLDAKAAGFDINDPEFYGGDLAADVGANPFYSIESVPGNYRYGNQMPDRGQMPMMPENGMSWQLMDEGGSGDASKRMGASLSSTLQGNPYLGASIDELALALEDPNLPEDLRQAALDVVQMYLHTDQFADGGSIGVNPYLGRPVEELIGMLNSGSLTMEQRTQVREAIQNTATAEPANYDQSADETDAMGMLRDLSRTRASDLAGAAESAPLNYQDPADYLDQSAIADYDARRYGTAAGAGSRLSPITPLLTDDRVPVMPTAAYLPGLQPLTATTDVPPVGIRSIKGRYEAEHPTIPYFPNDPRLDIEPPTYLKTATPLDAPLVSTATGGTPPAAPRGGYPGAPAFDPRMGGAPAPYGTNVVAPPVAGGLDFSQPGSMIQAAQGIIAGPTVTGTVPPSSGAGTPAPGLPGPSSPLDGSPGAPPFTPPIPMRPPSRGEADAAAATPLDDQDWLGRVMGNPYFQLGIAMMGSQKQGLLPAFADAASQVAGQRQAQAQQEWERSLKERGLAVDEGMLSLKQQALMADLAAARGGGGRGGGGGGGASAATVAAAGGADILDSLSYAKYGRSFDKIPADWQKALIYEASDPQTQAAYAAAVRDPTKTAAEAESAYIIPPATAGEWAGGTGGAGGGDPDWDMLSTTERVRRAQAYARGQDPTAGGFGGLGGLEFYGSTPAPPPGFVMN